MNNRGIILYIAIFVCLASPVFSLIHQLKINSDTRGSFFIESFGFFPNGVINIACTSEVDVGGKNPADHKLGFIIKHTQVEYTRLIEDNPNKCLLDEPIDHFDHIVMISDWKSTFENFTISRDGAGFYNVYFISCDPSGEEISFDLTLKMYNEGPNYLSAGDQPLPSVYLFFFIMYCIILFYWVWNYVMPGKGKTVMVIHHLMTVTMLLKMSAVFFHAVELHFLSAAGHPGGWTWLYFLFAFAKGIMFFIVLGLIGTGWSFIKPFLTERDTKIFLVVIPLQIISNIAMIILEETAPGSKAWDTWRDIFRLVDIICCIAVLVPIVNSIRHLKEAASTDGKAARNMEKLKLFREFYMLVISYIYFTRIIVFLLNSTLLFEWIWLSVFVDELCTFAFFALTGYNFRPVENNPYLKFEPEEESNVEEGDSDIAVPDPHSINTITSR